MARQFVVRGTMHNQDEALLDRGWSLHQEFDDRGPLWDSDIEQIERWPRSAKEHTDAGEAALLAMRDEVLAALPSAGALAPSLRTLADALRLLALQLSVEAERSSAHPAQGLHSYLFWAVNNFGLTTAAHGEQYLAKLAAFPGTITELRDRLALAASEGRPMLARHALASIAAIDDHLALALDADPLTAQPAPTELDTTAATAWREAVAAAIRMHVRPALAGLRDTLADVCVPAGRTDEACGLMHEPGGAELYEQLVASYTMAGMTAERVHAEGLRQIERLAAEYRELGPAVFATDELDEIFRRLRADELAYDTPEDVTVAAMAMHARAAELAPSYFAHTPTAGCDVRTTDHGAIAFYARPSADGTRDAVFFLNTTDPTVWGPNLASTVFHEGIPGHHFQLALAQENTALHAMHRDLFLPAFGEGWALYAERLADEIGLYETPIERLGTVVCDSLRACRLVVDTGMHALAWGRQQAIDFMLEHAPMGEHEVTAEVDRYIAWPGQATSYMMGRLEIESVRDEAAARLGDRFDLPAFHDLVLSQGMVSLAALRMTIEAWDPAATG